MTHEKLPYSQSALIFGILSIVTACCCWGVVGFVFGLIGLNNANKAIAVHNENPGSFSGINNANTGRITSIIGIVIGLLYLTWLVYLISSGGFNVMIEQYQQIIDDQM